MNVYIVNMGEIEAKILYKELAPSFIVSDKYGVKLEVVKGCTFDLYVTDIDSYYSKLAFKGRGMAIAYANRQICIFRDYYYSEAVRMQLQIQLDLQKADTLKTKFEMAKAGKKFEYQKSIDPHEIKGSEFENEYLDKLRSVQRQVSKFTLRKSKAILNFKD